MVLNKTIGIVIICVNLAGLGVVLYLTIMVLKNKFFPSKQLLAVKKKEKSASKKKKEPDPAAKDELIPEDDDLLKDMDLSDLDDLDLDDFK